MKLKSGAELKITLGSFTESKALYQACFEELKGLKLDPTAEVDVNLWKDLFCAALCSKKIEDALWKLMQRCTYNGLKIDGDTFEPEGARGDYMEVSYEVGKANILPFVKSLSAELSPVLEKLKAVLA